MLFVSQLQLTVWMERVYREAAVVSASPFFVPTTSLKIPDEDKMTKEKSHCYLSYQYHT